VRYDLPPVGSLRARATAHLANPYLAGRNRRIVESAHVLLTRAEDRQHDLTGVRPPWHLTAPTRNR
jgi:hypothetical protein